MVDPDGELPDFFWDVFNVGVGLYSLGKNIIQGKFGDACIDAGGVVVDGFAAVIPFVPGGVGTSLKLARAAEDVVDAGKATTRIEKLHEKAKIGQEAHRQIETKLKKELGAEIEQVIEIGEKTVRKDAIMPDGTLVIIKPNTPTGHKAAQKRGNLMRGYGYKIQTIFYDPNDPTYLLGSSTYIGPK